MKKSGRLLFGMGLLFMVVWNLPFLILGKDAIYTYHDQLDGEMIAYILQAKHLGSGSALPEFMGGAAKTALTPPAPACVLLFWLCMMFGRQGLGSMGSLVGVSGPLTALFLMQFLGSVTAYIGMYLLVKRVTGRGTAAVTAGIFYGILPFLPVYGLSQFGLPLLVWCVLCLRADAPNDVWDASGHSSHQKMIRRKAACLAYGVFFALNSSLVLVGFAVLAMLAVWLLSDMVRARYVTMPQENVACQRFSEAENGADGRQFYGAENGTAGQRFSGAENGTDGQRFSGAENGADGQRFSGAENGADGRRFSGAENGADGRQFSGAKDGADRAGNKTGGWRFLLLLWLLMAGMYCLTNFRLIGQVLGIGEAEVSHKTEYVLAPESFWGGWVEAFLRGGQHSADYHLGILGFAAVLVFIVYLKVYLKKWLAKKRGIAKGVAAGAAGERIDGKISGVILFCLGINLIFSFIAALWNSSAGVALRTSMGALGAFQVDRFLWMAPCLWYLILGCCVGIVAEFISFLMAGWRRTGSIGNIRGRGILRLAGAVSCVLILLAVLGGTGLWILKNSDVKANLQKLHNPDYPILSYSDYYGLGVLNQAADFLRQETGMDQEDYRVVSLGIDPAAALYHGFYCLDGYSNNYSLEYKHAFRRVIAPALAQSEYLRAYFDDWGNRCYIFGTESPGYYTIEKNGFYFQHLEMDTEALRELGGDYLLSAAYIANSEELGLRLMRQEPFETEESYYRIFLYEVKQREEGQYSGD